MSPAARRRQLARASARPSTMALFFEPKPRQLQSAAIGSARPADGRQQVEVIAVGVRVFEVDRRRQVAVGHGQRGGDDPDAPLAPCGWPIIDLVEDPGVRAASGSEQLADAPRLDRVVEDRRGAVVVDVADLLDGAAGSLDCQPHRADDLLAVGIHLHAVIGVAGGAVAVDRRVHPRAPRAGAVFTLEHHHPGAFAEHEAVAAAIEGARGCRRRVVVARRDDAHLREAEDHAGRDAGVGAAGEDHLGFAAADQRRGVGDGVGRARAARRHDVADAVQLERDRDLARHHPDDRDGDRVGRDPLPAVGEELRVLPLGDVDAAGAAADEHAGVGLVQAQSGIGPRFPRGDHGDQRRLRVAARIGAADRRPAWPQLARIASEGWRRSARRSASPRRRWSRAERAPQRCRETATRRNRRCCGWRCSRG